MEESYNLFTTILEETNWYRVQYKSEQYKHDCETPCWTNFYGGISDIDAPYQAVPLYLQKLNTRISQDLGGIEFNSILLRLYFDGNDNIAWHTDGRSFLGNSPTIASLSIGAAAQFQMRRMTNVWPCGSKDDGIDKSALINDWRLGDGDLLIMKKDT